MFYRKEDIRLKIEPVPSVNLRCEICDGYVTGHDKGCSSRYLFEPGDEKRNREYLWLVNYFQKYGEGSIWGKWIQDSLNMTVTYHDMSTVV